MTEDTAAWPWSPADGPARLRDELARRGFARVTMGEVAREAALAPWAFTERLLGVAPALVERQPIRPVVGGRSFASTRVFTPLHTDSQRYEGCSPAVQIMVCARAAERGGESVLVDGWAALDRIAARDPALLRALFETPRRIPFVFGDVYGPTVGLRGGMLTLHHSPMDTRDDPLAGALQAHLDRAPRVELAVKTGEVMVIDNLRVLHGRNAFDDGAREFVRLLVWTRAPLGRHPKYESMAAEAARALDAKLIGAPPEVRARFGLTAGPDDDAAVERRLRVVIEMLGGAPPGMLAAREGVPEPELYAWREQAIRGARRALTDGGAAEDVTRRWFERLRAGAVTR
jgi:hypothetical protein